MNRINSTVKALIAFLAVINIVAMMIFEYGLPSLSAQAASEYTNSNKSEMDNQSGDPEVGTIESVQKEEANKETEAADTALAKNETEEKDEEDAEEVDPEAPRLELTDDHIYLKVGDRFNYMSYIKVMEDVDGSDLSHYIYLDRDVDTSEPGEIELVYRITSTITGKSTSRTLLITITE